MSQSASQPFIRHQDLPSDAVPVVVDVVTASEWERTAQNLSESQRVYAQENKFKGDAGQKLRLPEADGRVKRVLLGMGPDDDVAEMRLGSLGASLPAGYYRFGSLPSEMDIRCLLYTSPSPRDGLLSRMPSSA